MTNLKKPPIKKSINSEFERVSVPEKNHKTWKSFLGMYAGEHAAGTEFMIGPLFLTVGVSAFDLIVGLFFGNLFAVLSWRYLTAKIAVKERFTLYFKLEKISGKKLVKFYNVANGILFCFLAGAMITVSATAVGVPTNMKMPTLSDVLPNSYTWILIVLIIGMITTLIASNGYSIVSKVSNWMSPVIIFAFFGCGLVSASQLGITSMSDLLNIWGSGSEPFPGQIKYSFWHVFFWSWFANAAMHIGMSDLSVFRYAKSSSSGWTTAAGMYIGHYMAWIAACLLYAVYLKTPEAINSLEMGLAPEVAPGPLAYNALGWFGVLSVILAGWTTANPTIYRSGLAFQALIPKLSIKRATIIAGLISTIAGIFPAFAMKLLDFVSIYGFILAPFGAIIVFEFFFFKKLNLIKNYSEKKSISFNYAVFFAWFISFVFFYLISFLYEVFLSFLTLPAWIFCGIMFLLFSKFSQRND